MVCIDVTRPEKNIIFNRESWQNKTITQNSEIASGHPYKGDLTGGMNLGYTGKPYDTATGLYNYGYRDYKPQAARFTTIDPIRDGSNWYAYVNNDPVNWRDLWGLEASDPTTITIGIGVKVAIVVGIGLEVGIAIDTDGGFGLYGTVSVGIGTQIGLTGQAGSVASNLLGAALGGSLGGTTSGSVQTGTSSSTTVEAGMGIGGSWNLNNVSTGMPSNGITAGSVGGGVWNNYTGTVKVTGTPSNSPSNSNFLNSGFGHH